VEQTKRQVKIRIKEHINNIKLEPSRHSIITEHILEFKHSFDWKNKDSWLWTQLLQEIDIWNVAY